MFSGKTKFLTLQWFKSGSHIFIVFNSSISLDVVVVFVFGADIATMHPLDLDEGSL